MIKKRFFYRLKVHEPYLDIIMNIIFVEFYNYIRFLENRLYAPIYNNQEIIPYISRCKMLLSHNFLVLRYRGNIFYVLRWILSGQAANIFTMTQSSQPMKRSSRKKENITSGSEPITRKYYLRANKEARCCSSGAHFADWSRAHNG